MKTVHLTIKILTSNQKLFSFGFLLNCFFVIYFIPLSYFTGFLQIFSEHVVCPGENLVI
jgi:hypothetical protein